MQVDTDDTAQSTGLTRVAWLTAGWLSFAVGAVGVVLPGIPTTGPMLLALACFARSSPRFRRWLYHHRIFGPPLQRFQRDRIIPLRAKVLALSMMLASLVYLTFFSSVGTWAVMLIAALMAVGAFVILRYPHERKSEPPEEQPSKAT